MFKLENYPSSEPDERIVLSLRRHWFILFKSFLGFLILCAIPAVIFILLSRVGLTEMFNGPIAYPLTVTGLFIYYLGLISYMYNAFVDFYLDNWIVTNHRIISIEAKNLFNRTVSAQALYRVQDVTAESKGFAPTFLNYGTIYIQTAAEKERFVFMDVQHPFENARLIEQLITADKECHKGMQ